MATTTNIAFAQQANMHLIGVFVFLALTGFYIHVFLDTMTVLLRRRSTRGAQPRWLIAATLFLFVDLLVDIILVLIRLYNGLRVDPHNLSAVPGAYFTDQSTPFAVIPDVCLSLGMILTDGIMVYRTYVVWGFNRGIAAAPAVIWAANIGTTIWVIVGLVSAEPTASVLVYLSHVLTRVTVTAVLTFVLNLLCAGLISWKVLEVGSGDVAARFRPSKVVEVIVQSAGIWCASLLIFIVTAMVRSPAFFIVLDCMMPIMTTVFSLIIIRLWRQAASTRSHTAELSDVHFETSIVAAQFTSMEVEMDPVRVRMPRDPEEDYVCARTESPGWSTRPSDSDAKGG
ncbi:hypothetical protein K488DRAFT_87951 [Vararia minispora EC-137]|uniref:Uncharacterized protein n=1 Tax=Vararia minispora EC-137 TaxID=1314806 RepID=A0ACB8QEX8_9AGAM|nr:hypothetical protein K488DRAFT_87951 [Vararia minispora EC-137]